MECFGDSSSEDDNDDETRGNETTAAIIERDESCGVCSFHPNTESSLLAHVRNSLRSAPSSPTTSSSSSPSSSDERRTTTGPRRSSQVLEAIDSFCASRHWMMHVGPEKGSILVESLRDAMRCKTERERASPSTSTSSESESNRSDAKVVPFVAVELGTYCGYASVLMGRAFREANSAGRMDCHLFTAEIDPGCADVASELIRLGGADDLVSVLRVSYDGRDTDLVDVVGDALNERGGKDSKRDGRNDATIDFLFVDHDKDAYLHDLRRLEGSGMMRRGTRVVADNVVFAEIDDYVGYVRRGMEEGVVATRTVPCRVEYSGDDDAGAGGEGQRFLDGMEITDYLRDP